MISKDDFLKIEVKIGKIISVEKVPETEKLLKLSVDFGIKPVVVVSPDQPQIVSEERDVRQIISGISKFFPNEQDLVGKKCPFVTNLEPRVIKGLESQGMIMAASGGDGVESNRFSLLEAPGDVLPGDRVI